MADASLVLLARRFRTRRILTLDERCFRVLTPLQGGSFQVLPETPRRTAEREGVSALEWMRRALRRLSSHAADGKDDDRDEDAEEEMTTRSREGEGFSLRPLLSALDHPTTLGWRWRAPPRRDPPWSAV